jgi:hypothetical protein
MFARHCDTCGRYDCAEYLCGTEFDVPDYIRSAPDYGGPTYEESVAAYNQQREDRSAKA